MRRESGRSPLTAAVVVALTLGLTLGSAAPAVAAAARPRLFTLDVAHVARGGITVGWRTRTPLRSARLTVNGRRVTGQRAPVFRAARRILALDAADGVRFGRNRLVAVGVGAGGRRQTVRRSVIVRRDAPLPAVQTRGPRVAGRPLRLDGRRSRSAGRAVRYRWRIVAAPRGARARLRAAGTRTPRLLASAPGRYAIALTVRHRAAARRGAAAAGVTDCAVVGAAPPTAGSGAAAAAPSVSTPAADQPRGALTRVAATSGDRPATVAAPRASTGCATQVEEVQVAPNALPVGVAIDTHAIVDGTPSIVVGGQSFPLPPAGKGPALALFDAQTLQLLHYGPLPLASIFGDVLALGAAESFAAPYVQSGQPVVLVVAGVAGCCAGDRYDSVQGFSAIETFGSIDATPVAARNDGMVLGGDADQPGEQIGWLRPGVPLDGAPSLYAFASPDRATFDTQVGPPQVTGNTMQIGTATYPAALPPEADGGYQVVVVDQGLQPVAGTPQLFATNGPQGAQQEAAMAALLWQATQSPGTTTFVQSIGSPLPVSARSIDIAHDITLLGGSGWLFLSSGGNGQYALVGNPPPLGGTQPLTPWAAETSGTWTASASGNQGPGEGSLTGVLRRRGDSAYAPAIQSAVGTTTGTPPDYGLEQLAVQPPQAWPASSTPGQVAATTWIARALGLQPGPGSCWIPPAPDVRSSYCDQSIDVAALLTQLGNLAYPPSHRAAFTRTDFATVRAQLATEMADVAAVQRLIAALQAPLGAPGTAPAVDASSIAAKIVDALPAPSTSPVSANLAIAGSVFDAAALVPEAGAALGVFGAALDFAAAVTQSGGTTRPYWQVEAAAGQVGAQTESTLATMSGSLGQLEEILVSDWGRLSTAAKNAKSTWGMNAQVSAQLSSTLNLGITQSMWGAILPAAYGLYSFGGVDNAAQIGCDRDASGNLWRPWANASPQGSFLPLNEWSSGSPTSSGVMAMLSGSVGDTSSIALSPSMAQALYGAPQNGGAGLIAPWLLARSPWTVTSPPWVGQWNKKGSCLVDN